MRYTHFLALSLFALVACGFAIGCNDTADDDNGATEVTDDPPGDEHDHAHPTKGPHDGDLIELGNEAYHAELVHDEEQKQVTIYILDGVGPKTYPIEAQEITINVKAGEQGHQYWLTAAPLDDDPDGKSSRFQTDDEELNEFLDNDDAEKRLVLKIGEKSYSGEIGHDHDHDH